MSRLRTAQSENTQLQEARGHLATGEEWRRGKGSFKTVFPKTRVCDTLIECLGGGLQMLGARNKLVCALGEESWT